MTAELAPIVLETHGNVGLIGLNAPPVNAIGAALRAALVKAIHTLNADPAIKVIALYGEGRGFCAGADVREFGKPAQEPILTDALAVVENSAKPVLAVVHGATLGGGLELALCAHARIGVKGAKLGLPEVTLGILPGAGGTQRLPRLLGYERAIALIASGSPFSAEEALEWGLFDRLETEGSPRALALTHAPKLLTGEIAPRRTGAIALAPAPEQIAEALEKQAQKRPALNAPKVAIQAISHAHLPIAEGLKKERELALTLLAGDERKALVHAFLAERAVKRIPEAEATARLVRTAAVIGGGTMGVGIATALVQSGLPVILMEMTPERAALAGQNIAKNLDGAVKRGKMTAAARDTLLAGLKTTTEMQDLAQVDLVIEAVFEDMAVKTDLFTKLDAICKPGAILGTNTSYLDVNAIAAVTSRPQDVVGLHFFSPAHVMRLLEIVVADKTAPEVVASALELANRTKKIAVRSGVCDGFIGNRILAHYRKASEYMLLDGASFAQIDQALENFGFAMGPFAVSDLAGLDIGWAARKRRAPSRPAAERYVTIADRICELGMFGRKTGQGFYDYAGSGPRSPNPKAEAIVAEERAKAALAPKTFTEAEIVARYMTAMVIEATRVVEEGIALRPVDVDAVLLFGYGFPRHVGGPLHYADAQGAQTLVERIEGYALEDAHYWQVPALLRKLAQTGGCFADLN